MPVNNHYPLHHGYNNRIDRALDGYGLTVPTIQHWLFSNHLAVQPIKILNPEPKKWPQHLNEKQINQWLNDNINNNQIHWFNTTELLSEAILMAPSYRPSEKLKMLPTQKDLRRQLIQAIRLLYAVPDDKLPSLIGFVEEYSYSINICDQK